MKANLGHFMCASAGRSVKGKGDDTYACRNLGGLALAVVSDGASIIDTQGHARELKSAWLSASIVSGLERIVEDLTRYTQHEVLYEDVMLALHAIDNVMEGYIDLYSPCRKCGSGFSVFLTKLLSVFRGSSKAVVSAATLAAVIMHPSWVITVKAGDSHALLHFVPYFPSDYSEEKWRRLLSSLLAGTVMPLPAFGEEALAVLRASLGGRRIVLASNYLAAPASILTEGAFYAAHRSGYSCLVGVVASDGIELVEGLYTLTLSPLREPQGPQGKPASTITLAPRKSGGFQELLETLKVLDKKLVKGLMTGINSLLYTVPDKILQLNLSHIVALAACYALQNGDSSALEELLKHIVESGYSDEYDDASIAVVVGEIRVEGKGSDKR